MYRLLFVIVFSYSILPSSGQLLSDTAGIHLLQLRAGILSDSTACFDPGNIISVPLVGCLGDPVVQKRIGVSLVSDIRKPLPGIMLDIDPLYFTHLNSDFLIRFNFRQDYIINAGFETKHIFPTIPFNSRVEYKSYNLCGTPLNGYQKGLSGLVYRIQWAKIGVLAGLDNYQHQRNLGYEIYLDYKYHTTNGKCCVFNRATANFSTGIGYWRAKLNYTLKLTYFISHGPALAIEYSNLYDFKELLLSIRLLN